MSYPDVVRLFREFLGQVSSGEREVRIGIDELDKMGEEAACRFLNGIKVVLGIPGCFFFIAVSEDAMSSFERRGVPFRDVFDSSFDDVLWVPHLELETSIKLLARRVVGLPLPFAYLLHCLSGGLPRDLVRAARDLFELPKGTPLTEAAADLAGGTLRRRVEATKIAARRFESEDGVGALVGWLEKVRLANPDPVALLAVCGAFEDDFLLQVSAFAWDEDLAAERRELQALGTQLAASAYLVGTMLEWFAGLSSPDLAEAAMAPGRAGEPSAVDRLAGVVQVFPVDVASAWQELSEWRIGEGLPAIEFPRVGLATSRT